MTWTSDKIKLLRCRLGWTQAELARKLNCKSDLVSSWESSRSSVLTAIELHIDTLMLLEKQAEFAADQIFQNPLAESILEETHSAQVSSDVVKRRLYEKN